MAAHVLAGADSVNPLVGKPLRYKIGSDNPGPGSLVEIIEVAYDIENPPPVGMAFAYCNLLDERNTGRFPPYREQTGTAKKYDEGVPDANGVGFEANLREQFTRRRDGGFRYIELDNPDAYALRDVIRATDLAQSYGLGVIAKNPLAMDEDATAWLRHPNVFGVIVEKDAGTPDQMQVMRVASGKPDLPIWFVFFGDGLAAARTAAIRARKFSNMGVTFDYAVDEYGGGKIDDLQLPISQMQQEPMANQDIIAKARSYIGRFHDGPDVPALAREVAAKFPDLASYCSMASSTTSWCGIFIAKVLAEFGIRPPHRDDDTGGFMWVDAWLQWGQTIPVGQEQPGDIAIFLGNPHHITFVAGPGRFVGGNQSDGVTDTSFRTPDAIRRAPLAGAAAQPSPAPLRPAVSNFDRCLPLLLEHEGGNDDDPRDPGGRTSRGILQREWDVWRQAHPGLPSDVWQAPQEQVAAIYRQNYWDAMSCDDLPSGVDYAIFDYGVNSGIGRAPKVLQRIVIPSEVDGEIGPNTIAATLRVDPRTLIGQICDERLAFLQGLSTWSTFGNGWSRRVSEVRANALTMTATPKEPTMPKATEPQIFPPGTPLPGQFDLALIQLAPVLIQIAQQIKSGQPINLQPLLPSPAVTQPPVATVPATAGSAISVLAGIAGKALPMLGLQGSVWGTALLWGLQALDMVGTAGGATATPTGGAVTAGLAGTALSSIVALAGQFFNKKQAPQSTQ